MLQLVVFFTTDILFRSRRVIQLTNPSAKFARARDLTEKALPMVHSWLDLDNNLDSG
jgi:hypothetical protein